MKHAYAAAEVGTSVVLTTAPAWNHFLTQFNLYLSIAASIVGILVGLQMLISAWRRKP